MHPVERLRWIARSSTRGEARSVAIEAAIALAEVGCGDPAAMVVAARALLRRNPTAGRLWWVASRLVVAADVWDAATAVVTELDEDQTDSLARMAVDSPDSVDVLAWSRQDRGRSRLPGAATALVSAEALGVGGAFCRSGTCDAIDAAQAGGVGVVVEAGAGVAVPDPAWNAMVALRVRDPRARSPVLVDPWQMPGTGAPFATEIVPLDGIDAVVTPEGVCDVAADLARCTWSVPPELLVATD